MRNVAKTIKGLSQAYLGKYFINKMGNVYVLKEINTYLCERRTISSLKNFLSSLFFSFVRVYMSWTVRRFSQSILKEISPEYSLEGLMLKLKLQYFGYLMRTTDSMEKTLMLGKFEGRRRGQQRMRWLDSITDLLDMSLSKLRSKLREAWRAAVRGVTETQTRLSD